MSRPDGLGCVAGTLCVGGPVPTVMLVNLSKQTKNNLELAQIMKSLVSNMFYDTIGIEDE